MAKTIKLTYDNNVYVLEYNRSTARTLERAGFSLNELSEKPVTMVPMLFQGAFLAHHRKVKSALIDEIMENTPNKDDLIGKLTEMYADTVNTVLEEPAESEGNSSWEASW